MLVMKLIIVMLRNTQPDFEIELLAAANENTDILGRMSEMMDDDTCDVSDFETCYDSDSDFDEVETVEPENNVQSLADKLANWASSCDIPQDAITHLLQILKPYHPYLPSDARTLLHTRRNYEVKTFDGGGEYFHFGIENCLRSYIDEEQMSLLSEVHLQINVDGLPLFKASNMQFWPILCRVIGHLAVSAEPFVVGLYSGRTKPPLVFLTDFVNELKELQDSGLLCNCQRLHVVVDNFVCDAPARAFVKCIKSHTGYSSCEKCVQHGLWHGGKVIFDEFDSPARTDSDFSCKSDEDHHLSVPSPLEPLKLGMVTQFPLDPMHLLYLGVVRRILLSWIRGSYCVRLSQSLCSQLSNALLNMRSYIPRDFCRRPRSLAEIDRWKATEFRLFLLYTGPIAIKCFVSEVVYKHFLLLSVASFILSSPELCLRYCDYAESLLKLFVSNIAKIYGKDMLVYNIHGLLHLADDVRRYGPLENFSAFPFENKLKDVKKLVRKPNNPLQQVIRRLSEHQANCSYQCQMKPKLHSKTARFEHKRGPVLPGYEDVCQFRQVTVNNQVLAVNKNDSCILTVDDAVCVVYNVLKLECSYALVVKHFTNIENFFHYPLPSTSLGILKASHLCKQYRIISVDDVSRKCIIFPLEENTFVVFPLLHQFPC